MGARSGADDPAAGFDPFTAALIKQLRLARDTALQQARQLEVSLTMLGDPLAQPLTPTAALPRRFMQREADDDDGDLAATGGDISTLMARVRAHSPAPAASPDAEVAPRTPRMDPAD